MIPEPLALATGVLLLSASGLIWVWRLWPGAHRTTKPPRPAYARFHDRPLTIPETVALDRGWCTECTTTRHGRVHLDGSFTCPCGHHQPITTTGGIHA